MIIIYYTSIIILMNMQAVWALAGVEVQVGVDYLDSEAEGGHMWNRALSTLICCHSTKHGIELHNMKGSNTYNITPT